MKRLIYLFIFAMFVSGCATTYSFTSKLSLGMTKQEVLAKCGNPFQAGAVKGNDGRTYETLTYKFYDMFTGEITTYVFFTDGKIVYYGGNPNMPNEPSVEQKK